ncbi:hypothetical protein ACFSLT_08110 [Novosphingobium resinovorum]
MLARLDVGGVDHADEGHLLAHPLKLLRHLEGDHAPAQSPARR